MKPYVDHVPVKADLSDLEEKIRWCREHDDECRKIGENAKIFYDKYVSRNALLDYVEMVCRSISSHFVKPPEWWTEAPKAQNPPKLRKPDLPCYEDRETKKSRLCVKCQKEADVEEEELRRALEEAAAKKASVKSSKQSLRERMRKKAAAKAAAKKN